LTRPEDREQIERFFDSQRRTTDEEPDPVSGLRPLAAERGEDLLLLDLPAGSRLNGGRVLQTLSRETSSGSCSRGSPSGF
jgi:hypothetical protein